MNENPNANCLAGMKCPTCGSYGPFRIMVTQSGMTLVSDDGTDDIHGDTTWDDDSDCECTDCSHEAKAGDFRDVIVGQITTAPPAEPESLTGTQVSLDGGQTWINVHNDVRIAFRDTDEDDDTMQDLLLTVTHEGLILDVIDQGRDIVSQTASLAVEDLIGLTH